MAVMKQFLCVAAIALLFGCQGGHPAIPDDEFVAFRASHPGMSEACLTDVRYGGFKKSRPDSPDCYAMLPAQRWSGLWQHGWEWSNFCPDPAKQCDWMSKRGTWLTFAQGASPKAMVPDGVHRMVFIGRRTKSPGNFGHLAGYDHLMVVERILSIETSAGAKDNQVADTPHK